MKYSWLFWFLKWNKLDTFAYDSSTEGLFLFLDSFCCSVCLALYCTCSIIYFSSVSGRFLRWRLSSWQKSCFLPSTPQQASPGPWSTWRRMLDLYIPTHLPFHSHTFCFFHFFLSLSHFPTEDFHRIKVLLDLVCLWRLQWLFFVFNSA